MGNNEMIITPSKEKGEPELPPTGLFLINPVETAAGMQLAKQRGGQRYFLFNSKLALIPETPSGSAFFVAGPSVGAPMAVLSLEKLIALGARCIIIFGWCGSLNISLRTGDVLLPTWAISDEGTSAHYPVKSRPESHGPTREKLAEGLAKLGIKTIPGPVWTTDAPYRESRLRVKQLNTHGIFGVDMEFAALASVAAFRKIDITAVLVVSDELSSGTWKPGFKTKEFKKKSREILSYLIEFCSRVSIS